MKINKTTAITIAVTAVVTCLATNTVRDYMFLNNNAKVVKKISDITEIIMDNSIYSADADLMADNAATALVATIGDKYTRYLNKEEYKQHSDSISSGYFGVGLTLTSDFVTGKVSVYECAEDGPSARAGVQVGDILTSVDGQECNSEKLSELISYIKSKEVGTDIILGVLRDGEALEFVAPFEEIQTNSVSGQMLSGDTGYVKIDSFKGNLNKDSRTAYDDFVDKVNELRNEGMTKLVIDLRDNPGGEFGVVASITDEILDSGLITYTEDKNGKRSELNATSGGYNYPMVIITNGNSASASEILTAALQDNGKAVVVGERTFGKGVVQTVRRLFDGSGIIVTSSRYFTPNGICIDGIGIEPDVECKLPEGKTPADYTVENDPQIAKALEVLKVLINK
ncbi:MAG: S41 family peptidase [Eubacteriales bacterium]|nr:S41 family peptidase [Eubacteriales bacterium]